MVVVVWGEGAGGLSWARLGFGFDWVVVVSGCGCGGYGGILGGKSEVGKGVDARYPSRIGCFCKNRDALRAPTQSLPRR